MSEEDGGISILSIISMVFLSLALGVAIRDCAAKEIEKYGGVGQPCYPNGTCYQSQCIDVKDGETICVQNEKK